MISLAFSLWGNKLLKLLISIVKNFSHFMEYLTMHAMKLTVIQFNSTRTKLTGYLYQFCIKGILSGFLYIFEVVNLIMVSLYSLFNDYLSVELKFN
jgi:hypothetical protein